jgi:type I restriction enzyme, S subunit
MSKINQLIQNLCPAGVEYKKLENVLIIKNGRDYKQFGDGNIPVYGSGGIMTYIDTAVYDKPSVLIPRKGSLDKLYYVDTPFWNVDTIFYTDIDTSLVEPKYIYYYLEGQHLERLNKAGGVPSLTQAVLNKVQLPVPPLEVQREIVRILDSFTLLTAELTAELTARKSQYEFYRRKLLTFDESIPQLQLRDVASFRNGKGHEKNIADNGKYVVVNSKFISTNGQVIKNSDEQLSPLYFDDIAMVMSDLPNGRALAKCYLIDKDDKFTLNQRIGGFHTLDENIVVTKYLFYILDRNWQLLKYDNGVDQTNLKKDDILNISIPVPAIDVQKRLVYMLDNFDAICSDLNIGLPAEIEARQKQYEYYRDVLLTYAATGKIIAQTDRQTDRQA